MGARLVAKAITLALPDSHVISKRTHRSQPISPAARCLLLVMCQTAKDSDSDPTYFGGSVFLARALGYKAGTDEYGGEVLEEPGKSAVVRAVAELVDAGLICQVEGIKRTWKRRWLITLPDLGASS